MTNSKITTKTRTNLCESNQRSSALDMMESRLGVGWKAAHLQIWCKEGRIRAIKSSLSWPNLLPRLRLEPARWSLRIWADLRDTAPIRYCEKRWSFFTNCAIFYSLILLLCFRNLGNWCKKNSCCALSSKQFEKKASTSFIETKDFIYT